MRAWWVLASAGVQLGCACVNSRHTCLFLAYSSLIPRCWRFLSRIASDRTTIEAEAKTIQTFVFRSLRSIVWLGSVACLSPAPATTGTFGQTDSGSGSSSGASTGSSGSGSSSGSGGGASSSSSGSGGGSTSSSSSSGGDDAAPMTTSVNCVDTSTSAGTVNQQFGAAALATSGSKTYFLQSNWWQTYSDETEDYSGL